MKIVPLVTLEPVNTLKQDRNPENHKPLPHHSGRSVDEVSGGQREIAGNSLQASQESMQNEANQKHSEIIDMQWQSHCQFYAECTHCLRLQAKPVIDQAIQTIVIINTNESCNRIKPAKNTQRRIFCQSP